MPSSSRAFALLALYLSPLLSSLAWSQAVPLDLSRAVEKLASVSELRFDQVITNPLTGSTSPSSGVIYRRNALVSVRFTSPSSDRIVCDGQHVWVYLPSTVPGQVIQLPQKGEACLMANPSGALLSSATLSQTQTSLANHDTLLGLPAVVYSIVPGAGTYFSSIKVWLVSSSVRQVEFVDLNGLVMRLSIRSTSHTRPPSSEFRFVPPAGARVVSPSGRVSVYRPGGILDICHKSPICLS